MEELNIVYKRGKGRLTVEIGSFLTMRKISKFKNLLKLIRQSDTPCVEEKLRAYIEKELAVGAIDLRLRAYANGNVNARTAWKERLQELEKRSYQKSLYKRSDEQYKVCGERVKVLKEEIRHFKVLEATNKANFDELRRTKEFFEKCLTILDE